MTPIIKGGQGRNVDDVTASASAVAVVLFMSIVLAAVGTFFFLSNR